jgi:hypothetical protein
MNQLKFPVDVMMDKKYTPHSKDVAAREALKKLPPMPLKKVLKMARASDELRKKNNWK